ncbi:PTS system glucose-specific transporter subunit IIA [Buchnera aphidicola (Schlechtendalia chinensis)]|uniref:PTS system glucose-specific EIIA component n=1 Tax=Buchnera aphidicola subsp. Schlechtendalia chinensis TaxID=118110 RepID=A0A172WD34_BUCSC|nr:PTS glucose transporter subunit IIA [Buchnera aphidicola]ANF16877.1 PTS system glucose-specific transporter subunit IIA [Buchnera aphidicola (Schlechtendalia chinensis)]
MNLFSNFFKNKKSASKKMINIFAPLSGVIVSLEQVPDIVFSEKIVGDGVAILPNSNIILSPIDGVIGKIFKTLHAFSIKSNKNNIELFVHFGIDTVKLKGVGFKKIAKENQIVKIGDPIISLDLTLLKKTSKSILTPIVISNIETFKKIYKKSGTVIAGKNIIFSVNR